MCGPWVREQMHAVLVDLTRTDGRRSCISPAHPKATDVCVGACQGFINASFDNIRSTEAALNLLQQFQVVLQRDSLKVLPCPGPCPAKVCPACLPAPRPATAQSGAPALWPIGVLGTHSSVANGT